MNLWQRIKLHPRIIRLTNWEYWSVTTLNAPLFLYGCYLSVKAGHPGFFAAANPAIYSGGMGIESKYETLQKIPIAYRPKSILVQPNDQFIQTELLIKEMGISYPLIAKPDIGFRGLLVEKVNTSEDLEEYLSKYKIPIILQELIHLPEEIGVFYHRLPYEKKGKITSITTKEFLHVIGDGSSSVRSLVLNKARAKLQLGRIEEMYPTLLHKIPKKGERVSLGIIGNHSKGTIFRDGTHLVRPEMETFFDHLNNQLEGVYYGRFDIKCNSIEDLSTGKQLKILEMNGVCSEPTHIYDPDNGSYWKAVQALIQHWKIVFKISQYNKKQGAAYMPIKEMWTALRQLRQYFKKIEAYAKEH